jgi:hypothetical protein
MLIEEVVEVKTELAKAEARSFTSNFSGIRSAGSGSGMSMGECQRRS